MKFTKKLCISLLLLNCLSSSFSQETYPNELFKTDSTTWIKEIIKFPLGFAPNINYQGFEDLRFVKAGWGKMNHPEFWSYAFGWYIQTNKKPTQKDIEHNIKLYYDGLMQAVNKEPTFTVPETIASFSKKGKNKFIGTIKTHDSFYTKKIITLNTLVEIVHCTKQNTYVLLFRVSVQDFSHGVWQKLNSLKMEKSICY